MPRPSSFDWSDIEYGSPEYHRRWRLAHAEHSREWHRAYDKRMYKEKPERERARRKRYQDKYPYKIRAHKILAQAVRTGRVIKKPCEDCGSFVAVAHHDYYGKPLDVMWLCELHHKARHALLESIGHSAEPTDEDKKRLMTIHLKWR